MPLFGTTIPRSLPWLIVLAVLPVSAAASVKTADALPRYDIRVTVKPEGRNLSVDTNVTLPAAAVPRKSLQFQLLPNMGAPEVRLIAPKSAGTLTIRKIQEEGDQFRPRTTWEIEAEAIFPAHQPISLHIRHSGGDQPSQTHYVGPDVVVASGINQPWYPQFSEEKALGSLSLDMPSEFLALATGERMSEYVQGGRRRIDFRMTWPTRFVFTAAPYKVTKAARKAGEIPVDLYLLRDRPYAADLADVAGRSIAILEKEFGRFPFSEFAVVEMPTEAGMKAAFGGASFDGYILMRSDFLDLTRADPLYFGHEIGHQWWGVSVNKARGANGEYMLDEALAHYSGLRVVEALRGPEAANALRNAEREKAINLITAGEDEPLARLPNGPTFYELSHAKGSLVCDLVSQSIGADRLRHVFHGITSDHAHASLGWDDYVARLKEAAGAENRWLIDQWINRKGLPILDLRWTTGSGEVAVHVEQMEENMPLYRLRLPVRIVYADGSAEMTNVEVAAQARTTAMLPVGKAVRRVELDPERTSLWASPQEFAAAVAVRDATRAWTLWDNSRNDEAEKILKAALHARTGPDATPAEFLERYNYGWLVEEVYGNLPEALDQYKRALQLPVRDEKRLPQLYVNIARVASAIGDKPLARWAAQAAIALDEARGQNKKGLKERVERYLN